MAYGFLILFAGLVINSFFVGKLFQIKYQNLKISYSYVISFMLLISLCAIVYVPFHIIYLQLEYFVYWVLGLQIVLLFIYLFNIKKMSLILSLNWKNTIISFFCIGIILLNYFLFFYQKNEFILKEVDSQLLTIDFYEIQTSYFSLFNHFSFFVFLNLKITINQFYNYYNYAFASIVMGLIYLTIHSHFIDNDWSIFKKVFASFVATFCLSFISFNVNNFKINLWNDSILYIICFNLGIVFFKKNNYISNQISNLSINVFIFSLTSLSTSNLSIILIILFIYMFSLFYKKIDFATYYILKILIYTIGCLGIYFLTPYNYNNPITVIYSAIIFGIFVLLLCFSSFYKKNNDTKYLRWTTKSTYFFSNTYFYFYLLIFLIYCLVVVFLVVSNLGNRDFLWFIYNQINFNVSNDVIPLTNIIFIFYYFSFFLISLISVFLTFKTIKNYSSNFILLMYLIFLFFNPLVLIFIAEYKDPLDTIYTLNRVDIIYNFQIILLLTYCLSDMKKDSNINIEKYNLQIKEHNLYGVAKLNLYKDYVLTNINFYYKKFHMNYILKMILPITYIFCSLLFHLV